jgi:uncharacterized protein
MHQYERNGVVVDQCSECKGIFLDRGELEKLVTAESAWYGAPGPTAPPGPVRAERRDDPPYRPRYDDDDDDHRRGSYGKKQRRRSFLEDLFD